MWGWPRKEEWRIRDPSRITLGRRKTDPKEHRKGAERL